MVHGEYFDCECRPQGEDAPSFRLSDAIRSCGELTAEFNRRMRKTACPVVWEGDRALLPVTRPDPKGKGGWIWRERRVVARPFWLADFADSYGGFEAEGHQSLGGDADGFASGCALGDGSGTGSREGSDGGSFASAG
jgi:hypothetical protein